MLRKIGNFEYVLYLLILLFRKKIILIFTLWLALVIGISVETYNYIIANPDFIIPPTLLYIQTLTLLLIVYNKIEKVFKMLVEIENEKKGE